MTIPGGARLPHPIAFSPEWKYRCGGGLTESTGVGSAALSVWNGGAS